MSNSKTKTHINFAGSNSLKNAFIGINITNK